MLLCVRSGHNYGNFVQDRLWFEWSEMENEINLASHYSFYTRLLFNMITAAIRFVWCGLWRAIDTENRTFYNNLEKAQKHIVTNLISMFGYWKLYFTLFDCALCGI